MRTDEERPQPSKTTMDAIDSCSFLIVMVKYERNTF